MTPEQFARAMNPVAQKNYDEGKADNIQAVLEIIDEENNLSKLVEETPWGCGLNDTLAKNIKNRVLALKGDTK